MKSEGQELDPKRIGQLTGAAVMEDTIIAVSAKWREPGMGRRVLDLSLLHPDLIVIPPTGNQEPVSMSCTQGLGRNGWRRKEG